jgi:diguanylate cyclase (GGDEF)-like protein
MSTISSPVRRRLPIAARFWIVLGALVVAMGVMGFFGFGGLLRINESSSGLRDSVRETAANNKIGASTANLRSALETFVMADDPALVAGARPRVEAAFAQLRLEITERLGGDGLHAVDRTELELQARQLEQLASLWYSGDVDVRGTDAASDHRETDAVARIERLVEAMLVSTHKLAAHDANKTADAGRVSDDAYAGTRNLMVVIFGATVGLGVGLMVWLIRSVVPRTRRYAEFAARVSAGHLDARLEPTGADELAALGRSLDAMVAGHEAEREYERSQAHFSDAMQVTETQDEANTLIKRHLERSLAGSSVVVLNRNNSDDRLEAQTPVEPVSALAEGLVGAAPRSCLAVRFGRRHEGGADIDSLLTCTVCGKSERLTTCNPLLVGGEVIGSVLVNHEEPLDPRGEVRVRDSVSQAAPVLGNLRNLEIAERRAATDALTGLPNARAVRDTAKRMVAHANRSESPLAVALLDLDHFKGINDTYGHGAGDEVLAIAAEVMRTSLRESDFVGRYGGEEFLLLLPDSDVDDAVVLLEKLREAIAQISVISVDRAITASIGVASLPEDGSDSDSLIRAADRALYAAKSNGRNRIETANAIVADPAAVSLMAGAA